MGTDSLDVGSTILVQELTRFADPWAQHGNSRSSVVPPGPTFLASLSVTRKFRPAPQLEVTAVRVAWQDAGALIALTAANYKHSDSTERTRFWPTVALPGHRTPLAQCGVNDRQCRVVGVGLQLLGGQAVTPLQATIMIDGPI